MTKEVKISLVDVADDTDLRSLEIKLGNQTLKTPFSSFEASKFYADTKIPYSNYINEEYKQCGDETLKSINTDSNYVKTLNQKMESSRSKLPKAPRITIVEHRPKIEADAIAPLPTDEQIDTMVSTAYSFSDITPIPSVPKFSRKIKNENVDDLLHYIKKCHDSIEIWNNKPIMGYVPMNLAKIHLIKVLDFYLNNGINTFYLDFDGTQITSHKSQVTDIKRYMKERGYEENCFFHILNAKYGNAINNGAIYSAKDLLGFGLGFDSLGGIHVSLRRPPEVYEKLKQNKDVQRNVQRVLCIEDYGYYRKDLLSEKEFMNKCSDNISLPLLDIYQKDGSRSERLLHILNRCQQCNESENLRTLLKEGESSKNTLKHYESKKQIEEKDFKMLKKDKVY